MSTATSSAFHHTCLGLVDLTRNHKFVIFSEFSTDALEKSFRKLRQGCGGTYFINVQQIFEKLSIGNGKLALRQDIDVSNVEVPVGHACELCSYRMTASELEVLEKLPELEKKVSFDEMQAVVYVAGYVQKDVKYLMMTLFFIMKNLDHTPNT